MMAPGYEDPTSTGYEYIFNGEPIIYVRAYAYEEYLTEIPKKLEPVWLKGRKNKKDNFKLK